MMDGNGNYGVWLNSSAGSYTGNVVQREGISNCTNSHMGVKTSMSTTSMYQNRYGNVSGNQTYGNAQRTTGSFGSPVISGTMQPVGTCSFVAINEQMGYGVMGYESMEASGMMLAQQRPGGDPIGQLAPVGDMVLPMMVYIMAYAIVKTIKKIKSNKTL